MKVEFMRSDDGRVGLALWDLSAAEYIALRKMESDPGTFRIDRPTPDCHRFEIWHWSYDEIQAMKSPR